MSVLAVVGKVRVFSVLRDDGPMVEGQNEWARLAALLATMPDVASS
ncbi:MAG: hypothetical protein ACRDXB_05585 [Actinomycetes bacterium]